MGCGQLVCGYTMNGTGEWCFGVIFASAMVASERLEPMSEDFPQSESKRSRGGGKDEGSRSPDSETADLAGYGRFRAPIIWAVFLLLGFLLFRTFVGEPDARHVPYSEFKDEARSGRFEKVIIGRDTVRGYPKEKEASDAKEKNGQTGTEEADLRPWVANRVKADTELVQVLEETATEYDQARESSLGPMLLIWLVPLMLLLVLLMVVFRRMTGAMKQGPPGLMSFGKSKARVHMESDTGVAFQDVAGIDEAVEELQEIVEFLKTPEKYRRLGGKIPKGVLLMGPPGTGKTLLARAVAGEANVPFFSLSGSEFVEMFVGVGAARVRDLFEKAQEKAPCIIFIDELDALAKKRDSGGLMGGHDEREQTLNQLLAEMDGFDPKVGLIVLAASNRPEILDPALMRPGRFDRQILVDRPDKRGRLEILRIHAREVVIANDVVLEDIAARTPGFAGADLANVCNEAALLAARRDASAVHMRDFALAIERVVAGLRKKNRRINDKEKEIVAFHEAGHALVALSLEHSDPVHKVSVIPHGVGALGYTMQLPLEDRYLMRLEELRDKLAGLLGGRAAEQVVFGSVSTGASNDLQKVTEIARIMVTEYGMSEAIGPLALAGKSRSQFLDGAQNPFEQRAFSEKTAELVDHEVKRLVLEAEERARAVLTERREVLDAIASRLLENEVIEGEELLDMVGPPRPGSEHPQKNLGPAGSR